MAQALIALAVALAIALPASTGSLAQGRVVASLMKATGRNPEGFKLSVCTLHHRPRLHRVAGSLCVGNSLYPFGEGVAAGGLCVGLLANNQGDLVACSPISLSSL